MATYFSAICAAEGIQLPANDVDARTFLSGAGASFSRKPGALRVAERLEGSAAVAWARAHIADDAAWVAIPDPAADILRTLYPLKASIVSLGGTAWVLPFRSLVQGQITPVSSPAKSLPLPRDRTCATAHRAPRQAEAQSAKTSVPP